jgi:hypothetical protein
MEDSVEVHFLVHEQIVFIFLKERHTFEVRSSMELTNDVKWFMNRCRKIEESGTIYIDEYFYTLKCCKEEFKKFKDAQGGSEKDIRHFFEDFISMLKEKLLLQLCSAFEVKRISTNSSFRKFPTDLIRKVKDMLFDQ